jgi:leader peptidase (prepilin peptidase)/N-methyltransferase
MLAPEAAIVTAILFGLITGSFLNVVIHRLPKMMERRFRAECAEVAAQPASGGTAAQAAIDSTAARAANASAAAGAPNGGTVAEDATPVYNLITPRSHCPACSRTVRALENIPVASYLVLGGRCAGCKSRISLRYPAVELLSGALAGYTVWRFGATPAGLAALLFVFALIALTFIDLDTFFLPDDITLPLLWAGLLFNVPGLYTDLASAVVGAAAGYLSLWLVFWIFKFATGKEGMGYGDFKLLAAIGAWLGWQMLPLVILLSSLVGAVIGILMMVFARHGRETPIPFGPYLAIAGLIALCHGADINRQYLHLF